MKKIVALLLILVMVLNLTACQKSTPKSRIETKLTATAEPAAATAAPTAAPSPEPTAEPLPPENWADIDMDFFREYLSSDITSLHQLVKDPSKFGIDYDSVERSLGSYKQDPDREWYAFIETTLSRMDRVDYAALTDQEKMAYDTLRQFCELELQDEEFYGFYEPLTPYTGIQADLPLVFWFYELNTRQDVEDYLTLLADVPRFFSELLEYEQYRAETLGIFMIEANLDKVLEDLDDTIKAKDTIFLITTFQEGLSKVEGLTEEEIAAYQERNVSLLTNEFNQAFVDLKAGLEALRPYCREAVGVKATGNEKYLRWYTLQLKNKCADDATPEFISELLSSTGRSSLNDLYRAYSDGGVDHPSVSMGSVDDNITYLRGLLDPLLPALPEVNVTYEEVAEELKDVVSPAFYLIPSFDDWQNNIIGLNSPEEARNLLSTLAHEGFNGHLYQYVLHRSMGLPLSQQLLEETAYAEAWSQYSELLLAENIDRKYTSNDLIMDFNNQMCVVQYIAYWSVRVNYFGDGFDKVYSQLGRLLGYDRTEFRSEIYEPFILGHPFYYLPYAYGYARLMDLHTQASLTLGSRYDRKAFDAAYLSFGPSYFNILARRLEEWALAQ